MSFHSSRQVSSTSPQVNFPLIDWSSKPSKWNVEENRESWSRRVKVWFKKLEGSRMVQNLKEISYFSKNSLRWRMASLSGRVNLRQTSVTRGVNRCNKCGMNSEFLASKINFKNRKYYYIKHLLRSTRAIFVKDGDWAIYDCTSLISVELFFSSA